MKTSIIFLLLNVLIPRACAEEMAVIAHINNNIEALTEKQVQDIFLGRSRVFPNNHSALPIDQASPLRADFYQKLTGRSLEQINAYWARIIFTGLASPPQQLPDDVSVLQAVRDNDSAIGYIGKTHVDNTVRILLIVK